MSETTTHKSTGREFGEYQHVQNEVADNEAGELEKARGTLGKLQRASDEGLRIYTDFGELAGAYTLPDEKLSEDEKTNRRYLEDHFGQNEPGELVDLSGSRIRIINNSNPDNLVFAVWQDSQPRRSDFIPSAGNFSFRKSGDWCITTVHHITVKDFEMFNVVIPEFDTLMRPAEK